MTTFLLDIWHDLREKRLWPVAVALLVATIAIPVVVFKPAGGTPPPDAPVDDAATALPTVALDPTSVENSKLGTFDVKNPFAASVDGGSGGSAGSGSAGAGSDGAAGGGGDSSLSDSLFGDSGSGGGTAGGSGGSSSGGSGDGDKRYFSYTVDITFGARGKTKSYKDVETLALVPDDKNPIVSFMGMTDGAKTAVFFVVDPAIDAEGEGGCNPSAADCRFVYLKVDDDSDEQTLTAAEGLVEYTLRLDKIHIKHLSADEVTGDASPDSSGSPDTPDSSEQRGQEHNLATHPKLSVGEAR